MIIGRKLALCCYSDGFWSGQLKLAIARATLVSPLFGDSDIAQSTGLREKTRTTARQAQPDVFLSKYKSPNYIWPANYEMTI